MSKKFYIVLLCCLTLLGCQNVQKEQQQDEKSKDADTRTSKDNEEIYYSLKAEEILMEPSGKLFKEYIQEKEFAPNDEYSKADEEVITTYVQEMKDKNTEGWDAKQWANSIVSSLRTNVGATLNPIQDFEVKYEELKLPDGRLLQEVSEEELNEETKKINVAVLIDASGSMKADVPGGNKMTLAKSSIEKFSESLPNYVNISLSVFGHKGTGSDQDKKRSCESIETVYPLKQYEQNKFSHALNSFEASGWTPLASTIELAEKELNKARDNDTKTFIYVVSDGVETCDGDPIQTAKNAKKTITDLTINIIGFDVDDKADRQLKEVAQAGGGEYQSVKNKQELDQQITKNWKESMGKTTWRFWSSGNINDINWASVEMSNNLMSLVNKHNDSRNRENNRMMGALNELVDVKIIDDDMALAISDLLDERTSVIQEFAERISTKKQDEITQTADELKEKIDYITKDLDL
ncbi:MULTISPECIES: VWA domain-containing protein [Clostridia]|uniref:VWA domain-containing protein n=1 Tax=Clostridia TaxID=186801 RepID=UPI000EA2C350|nr:MULTISPECIES: VWA domain-containing protein [Clostridia]NBJ71098.1 VWA domain-containing protein [Roseburia sp. 1XD42-34]RKI75281.1 VWA domain-containing protein [Clostridium sp. 1xD42-85]